MRVLAIIFITSLLTGCGAMVIETRGFDPATAAKIHELLDARRIVCPKGVASEERSMRAQAYNANRDPYYRPIFPDRKELTHSETLQTIVCK